MRRRDFVGAAAALPLARAAAAEREPPSTRGPEGAEPPVATLALHYMTWLEGSAVEWTDEHGCGYVVAADRAFR